MKILQVIHGYPPYYMAGSEVYTWNLSRQLAVSHQVSVFTRVENPYASPYQILDSIEDGIAVRRVNKPGRDYTFRDKYLDHHVDEAFRVFLKETKPDVVHFGHLSHLSTQLPKIARAEFGIPTVLTIHDFWMFCFRGQMVRTDGLICETPSTKSCLECAAHFFKEWIDEAQIEARERQVKDTMEHIDVCLSPSHTLAKFFMNQGVPAEKIVYSPYGFDVTRIKPGKTREFNKPVRFGFMGRIIPVKGIRLLLEAFHATSGDAILNIWGDAGSDMPWLEAISDNDPRVCFHGGYHNGQIQDALDSMDVLVAPSIWLENSPLVIQEAILAELPVITSDAGGMAELVENGKNGFLFPLGNVDALHNLMQGLIDSPALLREVKPVRDSVRTINDDADACTAHYKKLAPTRRAPVLPMRPAPRRVTFITNPGLCNLHCPMCDTHSCYSSADPRNLPLMDFDVVKRVVIELAPRGLEEILPSTMGEPLLYPHFRQLLEVAARSGVKVNLTTNGTFPAGGVNEWAAALLPVVSDIKFSVNAVEPSVAEEIMPGATAKQQLNNVRRYLELKHAYEAETGRFSTATIQATFMESNLDELPRLLRWAITNDLDRFKGHHLWVTWPQLETESLRRSPEAVARWNKMIEVLRSIAKNEPTPTGRLIRLDNIEPILADAEGKDISTSRCPFPGCEAWIEADGSFQLCCCPSSERKAFGNFGNVLETPFMELWTSPRYQDFVSNWGTHPNCLKCNMKRPIKENADD
jgi:glycosyltransferase involved in cell wall biosynthesis/MoaA/NifB/PqqE/SkfB family radical SAM enzyme